MLNIPEPGIRASLFKTARVEILSQLFSSLIACGLCGGQCVFFFRMPVKSRCKSVFPTRGYTGGDSTPTGRRPALERKPRK